MIREVTNGDCWKMKDGTDVLIRPVRPEDEGAMVRFHESLSPHSVYLRYFQVLSLSGRIDHGKLARNCRNDESNFALIAQRLDDPQEILAVARLTKSQRTEQAEVAVIVRDQSQHQGLGTELLGRLVKIAEQRAITILTMDVLSENIEMEDLAVRLGFFSDGTDLDVIHYVREVGLAR